MGQSNKTYKKFLATAATATLVATAVSPSASAATNFTDVSGQYVDAVNYLVENGIAKGVTDTTFGTTQNISRGDAAVMIANALELDTKNAPDAGFKDVNSGVAGAVNAIVAKNIASGRSDATFDPSAKITRQEMAKMLANAYELTSNKNAPFKDVNSNWIGYVSALYDADITKGKTETTFEPVANLTRGEFALFMHRAEKLAGGDTEVEEVIVEKIEVLNPTTLSVELEKANNALNTKDFDVVVDGKKVTPTKVTPNATGKTYTLTMPSVDGKKGQLSVNGKQISYDFSAATVSAIEAISATQVLVSFNQEVDQATAETKGNYSLTSLDNHNVTITNANLNEDGKSVMLTVSEPVEKRYHAKVQDVLVKDQTSVKVEPFDQILTFKADTTAPSITGSEQKSKDEVFINFSEPIQTGATFEFKDDKGVVISSIPTPTYAKGDKSVAIDLSSVDVNQKVTVTVKNAKDMAGNLISPQPATIVIVKKELAAFEPTIQTITQTGAKTFNIKFSEAVVMDTASQTLNADIVLNPANEVVKLEKVSANEYKVTTTNNLDGAVTVKVAADKVTNSLGQAAGTSSQTIDKLASFTVDKNAPKATATLAVNAQNKQVLQLIFDKDVYLPNGTPAEVTLTGSQIKDHVTTTGINVTAQATYADGKGEDKKVLHIPLTDSSLAVEGATYTLNIVSSEIKSAADVNMATTEAVFTRGKDGDAPIETNKDKATVSTVQQNTSNLDEVIVTFDQDVDAASATNLSNYTIKDAVIESANVLSTNTKQVVLKLQKNSVTDTYERPVTIKNVKAKNSTVTMDDYSTTISLTENVRPTISSAKVSDPAKITLTFSEALDSVEEEAFLVKAGTEAIEYIGAEIDSVDAKNVVITLKNPLSSAQLAQNITIEPVKKNSEVDTEKFIVKDKNGNLLEAFAPVNVVKP